MSEKREPRCESCAYWEPRAHMAAKCGRCAYDAPTAAGFPVTQDIDWCRHWCTSTGMLTEWEPRLSQADLHRALQPGQVVCVPARCPECGGTIDD